MVFELQQRYPALRPFLLADRAGSSTFDWRMAAMTPVGVVAIMGASLLIEVAVLGYDRSALKRLLNPSASDRVALRDISP